MSAEIRPVRPAEAADCAKIHLLAQRAMRYRPPDLHSDRETRDWMRQAVFGRQQVLVAESEGRIVGFLSLDGDLVTNLYLRAEARSHGIGAALLERAKTLRPGGLRLWVFEPNDGAIRFYEREGFRTIERSDGQGKEEKVPDRLMGWPER